MENEADCSRAVETDAGGDEQVGWCHKRTEWKPYRQQQISHERNGFFGGLSTGAKTAARYAALTEAETSGAAVFTYNAQA